MKDLATMVLASAIGGAAGFLVLTPVLMNMFFG